MKFVKAAFCLVLCAFLFVGCSFDMSGINEVVDSVKPIKLSGGIIDITVENGEKTPIKKLVFENISFTNTDAKITVVPSEKETVELSYHFDMEEKGFYAIIKDGEIKIGTEKPTNFVGEVFEVTVYANIEEIELSGGISVEMDAGASSKIDLDIKGGAAVYIYNVKTEKMEIDVAGAASMDLSGSTDYLEIELSGAGAVDAKSLVCKKAEVKISGAGSAEVSVTDELTADIDGVGVLAYYGDPVLKNISGGLTDVEQISKEIYGG